MAKEGKFVAWFEEVGRNDIALVGGKGANLGELTRAHIPVPPGFIVTSHAYYAFLEKAKLATKIPDYLMDLDVGNSKGLNDVSLKIKEEIRKSEMPPDIQEEILDAYRELGGWLVAVRSSATAEDLPEASFAGQQRTFLNIQGEKEVLHAVQECWASLFEPRAIFYRAQQNLDHLKIGIAVPVQRMVQADISGVLFTVDPMSNDESKIVIEAAYGLGEAVVSGEVTPDFYLIDKNELRILEKKIFKQDWQIVINPRRGSAEANIKAAVFYEDQLKQKLQDQDIIQLARLAKKIEALYKYPQDIEWAKDQDQLYILQARPVTTLKPVHAEVKQPEFAGKAILSGIPASPGTAAGPVKVVLNTAEIDKVRKGDILVAEMTTPDFVPAMKKVVGIITDRGGRTCHAAIVSRELGIPCIVGVDNATKTLKPGHVVTVDGTLGKVYDGKIQSAAKETATTVKEKVVTTTRVYVNLADPDLAETIAKRDVDGVGLLRAEFIIAHIGEHPKYMLQQGRGEEFIQKLAKGISQFTAAFEPRPVVYRTTDLKSNEYRNLKGGENFETLEENPMIGYRGCSRYVRDLDSFKLEMAAIKKVREKYKNLWIMLPFVRTVTELAQVKALLEQEGLIRAPDFKLWIMAEVPSNYILLDKFIDVGIDGISIGSNDLTQLILGIDRDNPRLAEDFDERNEAVLVALEKIIKTANEREITCGICGQAPSVYPELTEKLVEWGVTSVSVSPDMIEHTREIIAKVEHGLPGLVRLRRLTRGMGA